MRTLLEAGQPRTETRTERVLVVDGGSAFAEALVWLLERAGLPAGHATFDEADAGCDALRPTVLLIDAGGDAEVVARCVRAARRHAPGIRILVLGQDGRDGDGVAVTELGAEGRVTARTDPERLLGLIRQGGPGGVIVSEPEAPEPQALPQRRERSAETLLLRQLTARELEILRELMAGRGGERIAERLGISPNTVRTHVQNILAKLGAHTRLEAATIGLRAGLLPASPDGNGARR